MADGSGKSIKNSLLAATSTNFFEEAAMLVPVPIVEPQEPAIAEIDLNSDDNSSHRGSVEADFTVFKEPSVEPEEKVAAPISLFSQAATGVDAFTRMLAGTSSSREQGQGDVFEAPAVALFSPPDKSSTVPSVPAASFFNASSPATLPPSISPTSLPASGPPPMMKSEANVQFTPASSVFGSAQSSALFPPVNTSPMMVPFVPAPNVPMSSVGSSVPPPSSGSSPFSYAPPTHPNPSTSPSLLFGSTSVDSRTQNFTPIAPVPTVTSPTSAPPIAPPAGGANSYRLGAVRSKYVACPEMPSVPVAAPALAHAMPPVEPPMPPNPNIMSPVGYNNSGASSNVGIPSAFLAGAAFPTSPPVGRTAPVEEYGSISQLPQQPGMASTNLYQQHNYGPQVLAPLTYHWFYRKDVDGKTTWKPFSLIDSMALEDSFANDPEKLVATDGGRYDVCVKQRVKMPVYWEEVPVEVRRGSWFFKGPMDSRFIPYDEEFATRLEKEYSDCMRTGIWQKRLEYPDAESVIMHNSGVIVHFCQAAAPDDWGNLPENQIRPRVVKRGIEEIEVEDGESKHIDHLVFVVHGIGPICDFKLRNIIEAVDDFRGLSHQLLYSHFKESIEKSKIGRVEFLPVSWHKSLHGDKGIDEQLKRITLRSIPKFRDFTNDTLLDILFYTSPVYCQTIMDSVASELNRLYKMFLSRNPTFKGNVSLTGHSLGSLILFDLLEHQPKPSVLGEAAPPPAEEDVADEKEVVKDEIPVQTSAPMTISYTVGTAGTGQPFINYPKLDFQPASFFALGSPIAMFVTVRGIDKLGTDFRFPSCSAFFNIFHPYDPVAYRIETMIDPTFQSRPVLIPHHKGRKRIHLELKDTMARVGADIKHRVIDAVKNTLNTVYHYTGFNKAQENLESEIQTAIAGEIQQRSEPEGVEEENASIRIGNLNGGRRIDYVLQEAPYETFNEYVFAMSTHVGYWESEDTMLLILTEIYSTMGVQKDSQISQGATSPQVAPIGNILAVATLAQQHGNHAPSPYYTAAGSYPPPTIPTYANYASLNTGAELSMSSLGASLPPMSTQPAQPVPLVQSSNPVSGIMLPPNPMSSPSQMPGGGKPTVIGARPVADPSSYPRGMDPTAPIASGNIGPPPKMGFVPKMN